VVRFGPALVMIAIGATFAFAVSPTAIPGINLSVAGIIVLLAGVVALLLSSRPERSRYQTMRTWLRPTVYGHPRADKTRRGAADDDDVVIGQPVRASQPRR
jgi:ribose/xylose/arabinose/galactoside ABC-type transport system permease subunit